MTSEVSLREVQDSDLPVFFEHQLDPEAVRMASFPARDRQAFMSHWARIRSDPANIVKTIVCNGRVAGNVVSWEEAGQRKVGYWLGRDYWGKGIASAALSQLVAQLETRPLHAHVAKHNRRSIRVLQKCGFTISGEASFSDGAGEEEEEFILILRARGADEAG